MSERLSRSLTFIGLLGFGFNIMIGSGIFFLPGEAMAIMGPASVLGVLAALLVAALLVFCFAELSSQFSETGGPILYTHATLGPVAAFGVGWLGFPGESVFQRCARRDLHNLSRLHLAGPRRIATCSEWMVSAKSVLGSRLFWGY